MPVSVVMRTVVAALLLFAVDLLTLAQSPGTAQIPRNFKLDMETAARLRPQLIDASVAAIGRYAVGRLVFERLVQQGQAASGAKVVWQVRIVENGELNAYS